MNDERNLKKIQETEEISLEQKWIEFAKNQNKTDSKYIDMITSDSHSEIISNTERLRDMVCDQLKREIPNVEKMKSYDMLVAKVMHRFMSKQLEIMDSIDNTEIK